ncbi:MAG: ABC transporter ATP-binding protein [Caldilineaceae bacterium]
MLDIRLDTLRKEFGSDRSKGGKVVAVNDLTMTFPAGTTTCLLGPSGCGKTTLMRMIAGLEAPSSGDIYFGDERITHLSTRQRNIGMVFQYPVVYRGISVRENIELPLREEKLAKAERDRRVEEVVELLEMQESVDRDISQLDNGTRQKVAVARAVARQPRIILFDEPITNVDINAKLQLKRALKELFTRLNQTIIYVTHDQTEAMTLADRIALMQDGRIIQYAPPREIYNQPDDVFGGWFMGNPGMNFLKGFLRTCRMARITSPSLRNHCGLPGPTVTPPISPSASAPNMSRLARRKWAVRLPPKLSTVPLSSAGRRCCNSRSVISPAKQNCPLDRAADWEMRFGWSFPWIGCACLGPMGIILMWGWRLAERFADCSACYAIIRTRQCHNAEMTLCVVPLEG